VTVELEVHGHDAAGRPLMNLQSGGSVTRDADDPRVLENGRVDAAACSAWSPNYRQGTIRVIRTVDILLTDSSLATVRIDLVAGTTVEIEKEAGKWIAKRQRMNAASTVKSGVA
jgi:hypothetical protein